jgi:hypothetical protein
VTGVTIAVRIVRIITMMIITMTDAHAVNVVVNIAETFAKSAEGV